jgi:poly(beta-D-mannuronate) lyase
VVRAQNRGKVTTGSIVFSKASHVVLEGMVMTGANVKVQDSDYCRISRFRFKVQDATENDWISMSGSTNHTRIDHNDLGPKNLLGNIVMFSGGANAQVVQYNRVDHNYFHDVKGGGGNGWESLRIGLSGLAASKGFNIVEYNLFKAATGDPETISVKSCDNTIRYNTFRASKGEITLRHGNRASVYGNFIFADGLAEARGIRVCGSQHHIFNNYIEGITASSSINLEGGDSDGGPGDIPGTAHFRVYNAHVVNNTIVNGRGIDIGGGHEFAPKDCVVANNLVQNPSGAGIVATRGENVTYEGNISSAGTSPGTKIADPKLVKTNGAFRLTEGSPAIDSAVGSYTYVMDDMDGQPRSKSDVGADELSTGPVTRHPLTEADVGPDSP